MTGLLRMSDSHLGTFYRDSMILNANKVDI